MSDLEVLQVPTPRPEALCRQFTRRMDPWWGYAFAAGLLALFGAVIGTLAVIWLGPRLGMVDGRLAAKISSVVALVLGELLAYRVFVWWRRKRVTTKMRLIRVGRIDDAVVLDRSVNLEKYSNVVVFAAGGIELTCGFNVWFRPGAGATIPLLSAPDVKPVLAFDANGRMYNGLVLGVARLG